MTAISRRGFIFMSLALAACKREVATMSLTGQTMGTSYSVLAIDHSKSLDSAAVQKAIQASLLEVNQQMSNWDPESEISRFNAMRSTQAHTVSPALAKVMQAANDVHIASDGQFDVTMGPLVELWGFGAGQATSTIPSDDAIAAAMAATGQSKTLQASSGNLRKVLPETEVYLAAIGKGYGVDQVAQTLASFGIKDYMVEIGGDIYSAGLNADGQPWQIAIETPEAHRRAVQSVIGVSNLGMATSGDYRNYFERDGVRYSHIIDAKTGRPITHATASVTVLTENAMLADAWATALLVLGKDRGMQIADQLNLAALFIERDTSKEELAFEATPSAKFAQLQA